MPRSHPAAVLVPVFRDRRGTLRIVLIRRTEHGIHGGQIAFPGGRPEPGDVSPMATALRELEEEIGLPEDRVTILDSLPRVHTRSSRFVIQPFLAVIRPMAAWRPSPREVEAVLTPAVEILAHPRIRGSARVQPPGWPEPLEVEALVLDDETIIWGATYRILQPLLEPLGNGRWAI